MRQRPGRRAGAERYAGAADTPGGFRAYLIDHVAWLRAMQYSESLIKNRRIELGYFIEWCEERSIARPGDVTRAMLERYRQHVFHHRRQCPGPGHGQPLSFVTQGRRLSSVRQFFQWLTRQHHLLFNPASELELPRLEKHLPRHILTVAEIEQILNAIDLNEPSGLGIRDRAMLETLYSTGMRRGELVALRIDDVSIPRGTILIRLGKGMKDRVVPVGERALTWIERYLYTVRASFVGAEDSGVLFLANYGEAMQGKQLSGIVKKAIERANLERFATTHPNAACHLFRHACATHMLENGADIRYIQALLGHSELSTTEIYTRVEISKLKEVHTRTHPARMMRTRARGEDRDVAPD